MRSAVFSSVIKSVEPEAEIFCSAAIRTLLLLHRNTDHSAIKSTAPTPSSLTSLPPDRLRNGRRGVSSLRPKRKSLSVPISTGRESLSLSVLSGLLANRLHASKEARTQGKVLEAPDVLGRKYLDHIEATMIQHAAKRQMDLKARGMPVDVSMQIYPFVTHTPLTSAETLASMIKGLIERNVPFKRVWSQVEMMFHQTPEIRGIRVACAGRTSRKATKAKTVNMRVGSTSLATFSREVDYAAATAATRHGSIGLKVWIAFN